MANVMAKLRDKYSRVISSRLQYHNTAASSMLQCCLVPLSNINPKSACEDFKCVDGYQKSGPNCENINECGNGSHDCDSAERARCEDIHPIPGVKGNHFDK